MYCIFSNDTEKPIVAQLVKKFHVSYGILDVPSHAHTRSPLDPLTNRTYFTSLACTFINILVTASPQDIQLTATFLRYRIDLKKQHNVYDLFLPNVELQFRYNVSGRVLLLPITGSGNGVLVFSE